MQRGSKPVICLVFPWLRDYGSWVQIDDLKSVEVEETHRAAEVRSAVNRQIILWRWCTACDVILQSGARVHPRFSRIDRLAPSRTRVIKIIEKVIPDIGKKARPQMLARIWVHEVVREVSCAARAASGH